jgi:predicted PurR-regulated permease PerM
LSDKPGSPGIAQVVGAIVSDGVDARRRLLFLAFFFAAFLYLLYQLLLILSPFLPALLGAVMLVLIFYPVHRRVHARVGRDAVAAGLTCVIVVATIVVPVFVFIWLLVTEATDVAPAFSNWLGRHGDVMESFAGKLPEPLQRLWLKLSPYVQNWQEDFKGIALDTLGQIGNALTGFGVATFKKAFVVLLDSIVLVLAVFFFFRDGHRIVRWIADLVPMEEEYKWRIIGRLERTMSAIIRGAFVTASAQGALTGVGLAVAGVPFPVFLGFAAALLAVVPFVGCSLVWIPAAIYLLVEGHTIAGIGLALWGMFVVGLVDNFLRPYIVGGHAGLPILLLFLGILGGIRVYGLVGALISPLLIALVLAFVDIYREQYLQRQAGAQTVAGAPPPQS